MAGEASSPLLFLEGAAKSDSLPGFQFTGASMRALVLLLCGLLVAGCASTNVTQQLWETAHVETEECDDPGADQCTMLICGVGACGLYRCEDVRPGSIVRAQAVAPVRPPPAPAPGAASPFPNTNGPQRYWGSMQGLPGDAVPIFIIPWNESAEEYYERLRLEQQNPPKRTWVKHHVFPQEFKDWFKLKDINIHSRTIVIEKSIHEKIHSGGRGGPWNAAWRRYISENFQTANQQSIHLFATQMIFRFDLSGPIVPYYGKKTIPLFPIVEEDIY
jgi:uncharacterized lipoprotein (TIGR02269 family)